jgi:formylglycine-generating enzyme required for sulfatase activity
MHGNVHEWCSDWFDRDYYPSSPVKDPQGPAKGHSRVIRGGDYECSGQMCRAAGRMAYEPHGAVVSLGFRVAAMRSEK